MKKLLALALSLALLLTGCHAPEESPETPVQNSGSQTGAVPEDIPFQLAVYDRYSLHPVLAENRANLALAPLLYEPLFTLNAAFEAENVLCESYSVSEDGLTWTLQLRPGVTFSDGTPLTGEIAAAALNTARREGSRYASRLRDIISVTGGELALTITLSAPNGALPVLLDIPIAGDDSDRPAGTGRYVLTETAQGLSLTARAAHWQNTTLPVDTIPLRPVTKSDELILSFESGDVALVDVDLMGTNSLGYSGSYETWDYSTTSMLYLGFNTQSGLCRDSRVRQALSLAIDRESIAQIDFARHAVPSALPIHPDSGSYNLSAAETLAYDPEELVHRLTGLNLTGRSLTLVVNSENTARVAAAERITEQLHAAGLKASLNKLSFEDYALALQQGNFDLYLGEVVLTADFDLSALLLPGGSLNYGGWSDEAIAPLLSVYRASRGPQRASNAGQLCAYLTQEVPIAPICFKNGCVLTRWGRLSGLEPVRGNVFYHLEGWTII